MDLTHIRGLITPRITTHEPPTMLPVESRTEYIALNSDFTRKICTGHALLGICAAPIAKLCLFPYSSARQSSLSSGFGGRSGAFAQGFRAQALGVLDFQPLRAQGSRVLDVGVWGLSLGSLGLTLNS